MSLSLSFLCVTKILKKIEVSFVTVSFNDKLKFLHYIKEWQLSIHCIRTRGQQKFLQHEYGVVLSERNMNSLILKLIYEMSLVRLWFVFKLGFDVYLRIYSVLGMFTFMSFSSHMISCGYFVFYSWNWTTQKRRVIS